MADKATHILVVPAGALPREEHLALLANLRATAPAGVHVMLIPGAPSVQLLQMGEPRVHLVEPVVDAADRVMRDGIRQLLHELRARGVL